MRHAILPPVIAEQPWRVLLPLTLLVCFGAAVLFSAAGGSMQPYAASHLLRFAIFLAMALVISYLPAELVRWAAYPAYAAVIVLLMLVEALGQLGGGSHRWLNFGPIVQQPSELM